MLQWIKNSPSKRKDLSSDTQHSLNPSKVVCIFIPSKLGRGKLFLGAFCLATLAKWVSSRFSKRLPVVGKWEEERMTNPT